MSELSSLRRFRPFLFLLLSLSLSLHSVQKGLYQLSAGGQWLSVVLSRPRRQPCFLKCLAPPTTRRLLQYLSGTISLFWSSRRCCCLCLSLKDAPMSIHPSIHPRPPLSPPAQRCLQNNFPSPSSTSCPDLISPFIWFKAGKKKRRRKR